MRMAYEYGVWKAITVLDQKRRHTLAGVKQHFPLRLYVIFRSVTQY